MAPPWVLLKQAIQLFISNFIYFLKFWLVQVAIAIPAVLLIVIPMVINGVFVATSQPLGWAWVTVAIAVPIVIGIFTWLAAATYSQVKSVVEGVPKSTKELLGQGWQIAAKFFLTGLISGLLIALGMVLLIVPGIILLIWFSFGFQVLVFEKKWGWQALSRSREIIKGRFWRALWYFVFPALVMIGLQLVLGLVTVGAAAVSARLGQGLNIALSVVTLPLGTVLTLYSFLVYKEFVKLAPVNK